MKDYKPGEIIVYDHSPEETIIGMFTTGNRLFPYINTNNGAVNIDFPKSIENSERTRRISEKEYILVGEIITFLLTRKAYFMLANNRIGKDLRREMDMRLEQANRSHQEELDRIAMMSDSKRNEWQ